MRLSVSHVTRYKFSPPMRRVVQSLRLTPSLFEGQTTVEWNIDIPEAVRGSAFRDGAGDWVETISLLGPVDEVTISVTGVVETVDLSGVLRGHKEAAQPGAYMLPTRATRADLAIMELAEGAMAPLGEGAPFLDQAHALAATVADALVFTPGATESATTAAEALAAGEGVCQDHTHLLIAAARSVGMPARYVSGYLFSGEAEEGREEASHAWAELWVGDLGWVGFDAANRCCPDDRYIRLGSGLDASNGAPIRGLSQGLGEEEMEVAVAVESVQQ